MKQNMLNRIECSKGDITQINVDAIVNAANKSLLGGGGVDGAIHRAAGPKLLEACRKIGGCQTGKAPITKGFKLSARYIIHTVGPIYSGMDKEKHLLSNCYTNSLALAVENNLKTIAFPAISCGVYGYPLNEACKIAVNTTCRFLDDNQMIERVNFILFSQEILDVYEQYIASLRLV